MIIAVTGGRDRPITPLERDAFLGFVSSRDEPLIVRHGGASRLVDGVKQGVDFLVGEACIEAGIASQRWVPKWRKDGRTWRGAGIARNAEMLSGNRQTATVYRDGPGWRPEHDSMVGIRMVDVLIAWHGGPGTRHCVDTAHGLGIRIIDIADLVRWHRR